jgi:hypothetical protein
MGRKVAFDLGAPRFRQLAVEPGVKVRLGHRGLVI